MSINWQEHDFEAERRREAREQENTAIFLAWLGALIVVALASGLVIWHIFH